MSTAFQNLDKLSSSLYDDFGRTLILAVFPELYAIIAFAALFLIRGIL